MDKKQFEQQLEKEYSDFYKYIYSMLRNKTTCDDIVMITVEKALKNYKKIRDNSKFKSWLYTIGKRETFRYLQKYGKEICVDLDEKDLEDDLYNIEDIIINKEARAKVASIIAKLDDHYKRLIIFYYYYDHTLLEIAHIMGENLNTIKTWHRRALQIIKKEVEKEYKEE